ncbi:MAG: hypothetical protein O3A00_10635 [Planctomycetota bacterium]|nr:hypothetical protein [Planctomycetota bacterium]
MSFWPADINAQVILSPLEVLQEAAEELKNQTNLDVSIPVEQLSDRTVLAFEVQNPKHGGVLNLFEVVHQPDAPYPAAIVPPNWDIPDFVKRARQLSPRPTAMAGVVESIKQSVLVNEWVCSSPGQLQEKLKNLCAEDRIKVRLINLLAVKTDAPCAMPPSSTGSHANDAC